MVLPTTALFQSDHALTRPQSTLRDCICFSVRRLAPLISSNVHHARETRLRNHRRKKVSRKFHHSPVNPWLPPWISRTLVAGASSPTTQWFPWICSILLLLFPILPITAPLLLLLLLREICLVKTEETKNATQKQCEHFHLQRTEFPIQVQELKSSVQSSRGKIQYHIQALRNVFVSSTIPYPKSIQLSGRLHS